MKVYGIYEYHYANEAGKQIAIVSSKTKAIEYIKACIADAKDFQAIDNSKIWYEASWCYSQENALNLKNILKFRYIGRYNGYYVKEIEVL